MIPSGSVGKSANFSTHYLHPGIIHRNFARLGLPPPDFVWHPATPTYDLAGGRKGTIVGSPTFDGEKGIFASGDGISFVAGNRTKGFDCLIVNAQFDNGSSDQVICGKWREINNYGASVGNDVSHKETLVKGWMPGWGFQTLTSPDNSFVVGTPFTVSATNEEVITGLKRGKIYINGEEWLSQNGAYYSILDPESDMVYFIGQDPDVNNTFQGEVGPIVWWSHKTSSAGLFEWQHKVLFNHWPELFTAKPATFFFDLAAGGGPYTLTADAGSLTLTGADTALEAGRLVTAESGALTLTGADAALALARLISAQAGAYTWTGADAALALARLISAQAGAYTWTGADAGLLADRTVPAESGTYTWSGTAADLLWGLSLAAEGGSYTLTGADAGLLFAHLLTADAGSFTLTGADATLTYTPVGGYNLTAESGAVALTGAAADLLAARLLGADAGALTWTGASADLLRAVKLTAEAASFTLTGADAGLLAARLVSAAAGSFTLTGAALWVDLAAGTVEITFTSRGPAAAYTSRQPGVTFTTQ